jgi:tetratricopeptide (TPR) repeat protein
MKNRIHIIFYLIVATLLYACSTKKNTVINRTFHSITSKYNTLFNGNEALKAGLKQINDTYKDDYWNQLPIEPIKFEETEVKAPVFKGGGPSSGFEEEEKTSEATTFDKAEEKAVKAIQLHSMNIYGRERNDQIDDAYLLLGKARYYSQRFVPAIEAFNYVIANYPYASLIGETKIWRAKANIRMDNEEFAIESLKLLVDIKEKEENQLTDKIKEQAHTALAMAYVKTDSIQKVIEHLTKATATLNNKEQSARNLFILGQIYSKQDKKDSAAMVFRKLIDFKKAPYKFRIHANVELAKNFSRDSSSVGLIADLQKMIKNRDNRPYLDELYYQVGILEENNDSIPKAIYNYNKSIQAKNASDKQKTFAYERIGNIRFNESNYIDASAYYDSVIQVSKEGTDLRIRRIKRKHKNLASLIKYEGIVKKNDSIITIALMPEEEQKAYFQTYIDKIKKEDEDNAQKQLNALAFGGSFGGNSLQSTNQGKWYFYNLQSVGFGEAEFQKKWGNRALEDDWRWSSKQVAGETAETAEKTDVVNQRYDVATYLGGIPTYDEEIDSLKTDRNKALFELGLIYKEQFKEPEIAISRLERLLKINTDENLRLPIHYHLYETYKSLGDTKNADKYMNVVLTEYSETSFAQAIKFPNKELKKEDLVDKTVELYKEIFYLYKEDKYEEVLVKFDEKLSEFEDSVLMPKFELLKAYAIGKYKDKKSFRLAMEYVAFSYSETEEGKEAQKVVERLK